MPSMQLTARWCGRATRLPEILPSRCPPSNMGDFISPAVALLNYPGSIYAYSTAFILCLDEKTGALAWIKSYIPSGYNFSQAANTNVTVGDNLAVVYDSYNGLFALDAVTGDSLWSRVGDMLGRANPLILNNTVFFGIEGGLRAVNESNGQEIWHVINSENFGSLTSDGTNIYTTTPDLTGLAANGSTLWSDPGSSTANYSPYYYNGQVLVNNSRNQLNAYSASSGVLIWTRDHYPNYPVAANNEIFICDDGGQLTCLDAKTGNTKWVNTFLKNFTQPACLVDGQNRVYHITESGEQN